MEYKISNRAGVPLKGEIKAVWHRDFSGEFYPSWENDGITWSDDIGRTTINISNNERYYEGEITCKITTNRPDVSRCTPVIHLYYKAERSDKWEYLRCDCDNTLQSIKGIEDQEIRNETGELIGGISITMNRNNSFNFANINIKR